VRVITSGIAVEDGRKQVRKRRIAVLGALGLTVGLITGPGVAHAAKVTATAAGGPVPNATGGSGLAIADGLFTQTFQLRGKKVKKQQVQDVNLTMNSSGSLDVNDDLIALLTGPQGDSASVPLPGQGSGFQNLKFDDQAAAQTYCNPFQRVASYCNYIQGATAMSVDAGFFTGSIDAGAYGPFDAHGFNPVFKGTNPKGTWRLSVWDTATNGVATPQTATLGTSTLEVRTGKKFAKE
jgi:hypothetical protein